MKSFEIIETPFGNYIINQHDMIGNYIQKTGCWEYHLYEFYSKILNKNDICVDAGANIGFHSIQFGKLCKKVYSFEPQPFIYNQLCTNILFNDLDNIIVPYRIGLGNKIETKQMWSIKHEEWPGNGIINWGGRGIEHKDTFHSDEIRENDQIDIFPLDSYSIPYYDLFKIDIQGYELYAFQGAEKGLEKNKPVILLENAPGRSNLDRQILEILKDMGYENYRYYQNTNEDCILIHPKSSKYSISLNIINTLKNKYNIKQEF